MRGISISLAVLLSFLIVATSISASTCNMACCLRRSHSQQSGGAAAAAVEEFSMPMSGHYMWPQMEMTAEPAAHESDPETDRARRPAAEMPCNHEPCSQSTIIATRQSGDRSPRASPCWNAASSLKPLNPEIVLHREYLESPPPNYLAGDRFVTILRI